MKRNQKMMSFDTARSRLAVLWGIFAGLILVVLVALAMSDAFKVNNTDKTQDAFDWFFLSIWPSLALVITSFMPFAGSGSGKQVRRGWFNVAMCVSTVYLVLAMITIFGQPFTQSSMLGLMERSHRWLGPLQGFVTPCLALLFTPKVATTGSA